LSGMGSFRKVLAALEVGSADGGPALGEAGRVVLAAAEREARLHGAALSVIHALPTEPGAPMSPEAMEQALVQRARLSAAIIDALVAALQQVTGRPPGEVEIAVEDGPAAPSIVAVAERQGADLVVVGATETRGLRRLLLGSVATRVVNDGRTSVLLARPDSGDGPVVVAVDYSPASEAALAAPAEEARLRQAPLAVVHAVETLGAQVVLGEAGLVPPPGAFVPPEELAAAVRQRLIALLHHLSIEASVDVDAGPAVETIVTAARRRAAALLVVGTSARSGLDRLLLGSVANAVVREAACPVLVARAPDAPAPV
jgi:nucleotide-binding universal stress UspA family protein